MRAELRTIDGIVELYVDGVKQSGMWGRLSLPGDLAVEKMDQYLGAGIDVYLTDMDADCTLCWDGEEDYDYTLYDHHIERIVRKKPDIRLILYVGCAGGAPYKWNAKNEDQLPLLSNGDRLRIPSFASERWLLDSCDALRRFVEHFEQSPFADNIIGYNPIQYSNEWHTPTSRNQPPLDDYSQPMVQHFRTWLREKYAGDSTALSNSWQEEADFESTIIPSEERRLRKGMEPLRFGQIDQRVCDYEVCLSQARERFILAQCRAIKESATQPTLTCLSRAANSDMMLISEWVDVHHGPYGYLDRKILHVNGYAKASYQVRGKLHVCQIDTGTHLMPKTGGDPLGITGLWPGPHRLNDSMWESLEMLERDVSYSVARNSCMYWNEGGPGWMFPVVCHGTMTWGRFWFDAPEIKERIKDFKRLVDRVEASGARSVARVALVASDYLDPYLPRKSAIGRLFSRISVQRTLARAGVPVDDYVLEDFAGIDKSYDVYIFPNAFFVPAQLRMAIRQKLAKDHATAIWLYGSGFMDESGAKLENINALTGIRLDVEHNESPVQVRIPENGHHYFSGLEGIRSFGSLTIPKSNSSYQSLVEDTGVPEYESTELPAVFFCDDPRAESLAFLGETRRCGMAIKQMGDFRSIWIAAPFVPWQVFTNILRDSGVHVYSQGGDQLMANDRFVSLYCICGGSKQIRLPVCSRVIDALSEEVMEESTRDILFQARAGETRSFLIEKSDA